ncbi:hypothetical protein M0R45_012842 [Rubus argutus]|uniref:Uncharacterized protein n=1 Tax=Rubus argutus TaxID=59490 RepID=A0AAW1XHD4_RUBAR
MADESCRLYSETVRQWNKRVDRNSGIGKAKCAFGFGNWGGMKIQCSRSGFGEAGELVKSSLSLDNLNNFVPASLPLDVGNVPIGDVQRLLFVGFFGKEAVPQARLWRVGSHGPIGVARSGWAYPDPTGKWSRG